MQFYTLHVMLCFLVGENFNAVMILLQRAVDHTKMKTVLPIWQFYIKHTLLWK